ncbi:MAG: tryptophan 7-halogenase [Pirellulales bacterium]|nr:tryptophan 7-halogenase [Pirellulales bacterium]
MTNDRGSKTLVKARDDFDVVIVGGGPAGSTAASVLAQHGRRVLVLEKEEFPRYHIGESLLPFCYFPLQRIGLVERMKASHFPKKYAVQFVSRDGKRSTPFYFFRHMDHEAAQTWQVLRSEFDAMLLDNSRRLGADVRTSVEATDFLREDGRVVGVTAVTPDGGKLEVRAPATIDASGRGALAVKRNGWRKSDPYLNKVALWTYFRGAMRDPGMDEGNTTVAYVPEKGWFWYIPLPDDVVSVGIVAERDYLFNGTNDLAAIYWREVKKNVWIEDHLKPGKQIEEFRVTKEYSYRSEYCAENGLVLVGDAFAFLDPVFSSGVYLALRGGELVGDAVHQALAEGDVSAEGFAAYSQRLCYEIESMRKLVYAFYDHSFSFGRLVREYPDLCGDVTDCLIGNLNKDFQRLFDAVAQQAAVPGPLPHGRPLAAKRSTFRSSDVADTIQLTRTQ